MHNNITIYNYARVSLIYSCNLSRVIVTLLSLLSNMQHLQCGAANAANPVTIIGEGKIIDLSPRSPALNWHHLYGVRR